MKKLLLVVDMQKDFIDGALGTKEAQAILPRVVEKIKAHAAAGGDILFTMDTHGEDYLSTPEGSKLPVPHCIKDTSGWELAPQLEELANELNAKILEKPTFGSISCAEYIRDAGYEEVEIVGLCTDICVVSNALILKAAAPYISVSVDGDCCAGVTPESHRAALETMKMCQIQI